MKALVLETHDYIYKGLVVNLISRVGDNSTEVYIYDSNGLKYSGESGIPIEDKEKADALVKELFAKLKIQCGELKSKCYCFCFKDDNNQTNVIVDGVCNSQASAITISGVEREVMIPIDNKNELFKEVRRYVK